MEYIDLLAMLRSHNRKLERVTVYGYIMSRLPKPSNLLDTCDLATGGIFVRMKVCAVDLSYYSQFLKEMGIYNPSGKYIVNGSICLYVSSKWKYPDWYESRVTLRLGSKMSEDYVVGFAFSKNNNKWIINYNPLDDIDRESEFKKGSLIQNILYGVSGVPSDVLALPEMKCVLPKIGSELNKKDTSNISEHIESKGELGGTSVSTRRQSMVGRKEIEPFSNVYESYASVLDSSLDKLNETLRNLSSEYSLEYDRCNNYIRLLTENLSVNMTSTSMSGTDTGKKIIKKYLSGWKLSKEKYLGTSIADYIVNYFDSVRTYILEDEEPMATGSAYSMIKTAFSDRESYYAHIVGVVTKIKLDDAEVTLKKNGISISKLVNNNPYMLFLLGLISYKDADNLACYFGLLRKKELQDIRNVCMIHDYINDTSNNDTAFDSVTILRAVIGNKLTKYRFNNGMNQVIVNNMKLYFNCDSQEYDKSKGWVDKGYNKIKPLSQEEKLKALRCYEELGVGSKVDKYYTSTRLLEKELYVYEALYHMGQVTYNYDDNQIAKYIKDYESNVGFTLEDRQNSSVYLIKSGAAVLTGGAGSGKTTTEGCMVDVLKKLEPNIRIKYGAPTGKAAKVMQEVVKEKAQTMHSMCKVGISQETLFDDNIDGIAQDGNVCYIFDEMSMVTIDLLYRVLKCLGNIRVYFVGDIHQLSAIGKGLVLKNLLRFLPCEYLTVSKRSSENSGITYNSDLINFHSDRANWLSLKNTKDFIRYSVADDKIQKNVYSLCEKLLNEGVSPDDIQVVSPVVKGSYAWGATALNNVLQPLFNPLKGYNDRVWGGNNYFIRNDRVIHTKKNMYSMQWYKKDGMNTYTKIYGNGINNGEVGKFIGYISSDDININDEDEEKPVDFDYYDNMRDDSTYNGFFCIVKYYDFMSEREFYILYRCKSKNDDTHGFSVYGDDINCLELFYCGSVHKLQGSQARVIIAALGVVNFKGFITRNMIYTMITRASERIYLIGSVDDNLNSMLSKARLEVDDEDVVTIGELL